jgi:hypothetical protein
MCASACLCLLVALSLSLCPCCVNWKSVRLIKDGRALADHASICGRPTESDADDSLLADKEQEDEGEEEEEEGEEDGEKDSGLLAVHTHTHSGEETTARV